jgi:hypothetical protein
MQQNYEINENHMWVWHDWPTQSEEFEIVNVIIKMEVEMLSLGIYFSMVWIKQNKKKKIVCMPL